MITIKDLAKKYHGRQVLDIKDLQIERGEFLGIVGNNGAGKTTLLRLLLDLVPPDKGTICSGNFPVFRSEGWKAYTASYIDDGFLMDFLTPEEFFYFVGNSYGFSQSAIDQKLAGFYLFSKTKYLVRKRNTYVISLKGINKRLASLRH
ncbi:ATP-binding cassette domain-containing protein [Paraflavitalea speifideaquila]|uniref:ATP-binding cassette domain-containing protein n=1 Tax=Paraflavitalea speifideaquila TaxID=3076558 RepID=UPI0028E4345D|nr:ATP-binding cassette domain-containing protein [Paraflavitalea speifideiaquila]